MITLTELIVLLAVWTICSFLLGVFTGTCIRFGSGEHVDAPAQLTDERRQQIRLALSRRNDLHAAVTGERR